ncbi:unnamed protein product [Acanthoscelides obtectus]|uniref:Uncharacterized protein n=1 Tax=Acanthoscelides obtectus TaxID=200917 RepID=A0A9P0Q560_ACAOB|nr:unnamed protein product [Acanthoscelides obtectus]CAK1682330.1 hypothetical protein AOBTE_LOCUS33574 [Acanthoscelides obtectus]
MSTVDHSESPSASSRCTPLPPYPRKQSRDLTWRIRCSLYSEARHKRYCNSIVNIQYSIEFLRDFLVYSGSDIGLKNINNREIR